MPATPTIIGWTAAGLLLMTFATKDMRHLRILAILSNITLISYGVLLWLPPIFGLHLVLLPINTVRLIQMSRGKAPVPVESSSDARRDQFAS